VPGIFYNKTMLEKAGCPLLPSPATYEEFRAYLSSIKGKLPAGVFPMMDYGITTSSTTPFGYWLRYNGTPIYDDISNTTKVTAAVAEKYIRFRLLKHRISRMTPSLTAQPILFTNGRLSV
jgi:multiple sugar transport system substrate-binding protein